jgi:GNAT superfamily N-acetyltransferase
MNIRIYLKGPQHPIARGEVDGDADEFVDEFLPLGASDGVFIAQAGSKILGWLRYYWYPGEKRMLASGTWVEPEHRGNGVAHALWGRAMKSLKPKRVTITTVSKEGRHLVGSIVRWFYDVEFDVR